MGNGEWGSLGAIPEGAAACSGKAYSLPQSGLVSQSPNAGIEKSSKPNERAATGQ